MNLYVEPGHPDAGAPLLGWFARAIAAMDGEVVIASGDDNLVRSRRPDDPGARPFVVVASGLPNLVHEFVHAIQFGRLADDHGIDYGLIPLDVTDAMQRRILWEELACCVVSCAYAPAAVQGAWFKEQVEIQGVFYGLEGDVAGFAALVDRTDAAHPGELAGVVAAAYAATERALVAAGAPAPEARPGLRPEFSGLWARYRAGVPVAAPGLAGR